MPLELELELWPRQLEAFESPAREILFGGASEGGALPPVTRGRKANPTLSESRLLHGVWPSKGCNAYSSVRSSTTSLRIILRDLPAFAPYSLRLWSGIFAQSLKPESVSLTALLLLFSIAKMSANSPLPKGWKNTCSSLMKLRRSPSALSSSFALGVA